MRVRGVIKLGALFLLASCAISVPEAKKEDSATQSTEWAEHAQKPISNVFGGTTPKRSLRGGYYEQSGSVASDASWEAVAHYTYLGHNGFQIGIAQRPYSISPSGRFVVIPEQYVSGSTHHILKIYDSELNRFIRREIPPNVVRSYEWTNNECIVEVSFEDPNTVESITVPKP